MGAIRVRRGVHADWPKCEVWIGAMVDSKHIGIMANTWSTTLPMGDAKKRRVGMDLVDMQYREFQHWYYYGRHAVDDNNNNRQGCLSFEESYCGKRWDLRQFGFIIALAQVNAMLSYNYFKRKDKEKVSKAEFVRMLARDLIYNREREYLWVDSPQRTATRRHCRPTTIPNGCSYASVTSKVARAGHELLRLDKNRGKWNGNEFPVITSDYSKCNCSMKCGMTTRTFCSCDNTYMLCVQCYGEHIASITNLNK